MATRKSKARCWPKRSGGSSPRGASGLWRSSGTTERPVVGVGALTTSFRFFGGLTSPGHSAYGVVGSGPPQ